MQTVPQQPTYRQLEEALSQIRRLANHRKHEDVTARKIWNVCRGLDYEQDRDDLDALWIMAHPH